MELQLYSDDDGDGDDDGNDGDDDGDVIVGQCLWCRHHGTTIARVQPESFDEWYCSMSGTKQ